MLKILLTGLLSLFLITSYHEPDHSSRIYFSGGERIVYDVHYGFISAGEAVITIDSNVFSVDSHTCYKAEMIGRTVGAVGLFAKIYDKWTSYIDTSSLLTYKFSRDQQENNYTLKENTEFDRENNLCLVTKKKQDNSFELKTYKIKSGVQDMISTYFQLRNIDFDNIRKNDTIKFDIFLEDTTFNVSIKCLGREKIRSDIGKFRTLIFAPIFPQTKKSIFSKEDPVRTWITDDKNKIPVKIKANTKFGAIEVDIVEYKQPIKKLPF